MKGLKQLSKKEKTQIIILVLALAIGGYGVWYAGVYDKVSHTENMINRAKNRIKVKKERTLPVPEKATSENELQKARELLKEAKLAYKRVSQRFVSLNSKKEQQRLRHEISELATSLQMHVIILEDAQRAHIGKDEAPRFEQVNRDYGRPLLELHAITHYFAVQTFLDELNSLSYFVAPVHFKLEAEESRLKPEQAAQQQQLLRLEVILTM